MSEKTALASKDATQPEVIPWERLRKMAERDGVAFNDYIASMNAHILHQRDEIKRLRAAAESWESYVAAQDRKGEQVETSAESWRCFHCDELFTSRQDAWHHFGRDQGATPACKIKAAGEYALLEALRNAEDQLSRYHAEDSDTARAMHAMAADHQVALRREEEKGFARGIEDAKKHPETLGLRRADETECRIGISWIAGGDHFTSLVPPAAKDAARALRGAFLFHESREREDYWNAIADRLDELGAVKASPKPVCKTHGVELAFEGDECWECKKEQQL